jgi:hypothetical protein
MINELMNEKMPILGCFFISSCIVLREPGWDRTNGPLLKRQMLYH